MKLSVIIPTYHRNDDLAICLDRLASGVQTLSADEYEVIVTDDGRDSTAESMIMERYPWARWTPGPRRGPAANRNHGASVANADWIVFTDDDCLPEPYWLREYAKHINGEYDVLEGRTSACGKRTRVDEECPINETGGYLWSCNFAIRKSVFDELEGFDENFPAAAMEDVDLNVRIDKAGVGRKFLPDALVLHPWRREKGKDFCRAKAASIAYFVRKHPELRAKFELRAQSINFARFVLKRLPIDILRYRAKGCVTRLRTHAELSYFTLQAISSRASNS
jgi:GT2 family glycosyltransferase